MTNAKTKGYFLPALWFSFLGAISLGLVYQFYYEGGDTFNYYFHAGIISEAFYDNFKHGLKLIFKPDILDGEILEYVSKMYWYKDSSAYFVCRSAGFISLFTFNAYSSIAIFFAAFNFSGIWALYSSFQHKYPKGSGRLSLVILFMPSLVFWGSGILKDSICLGALGWLVWGVLQFEIGGRRILSVFVIALSAFILFVVKIYILICLIPALFMWFYLKRIKLVRGFTKKALLAPILASFLMGAGFLAAYAISKEDNRYTLDRVAERAWITAYDIRYYTGKDAGSGYSLGKQDGTWQTMLKLAPSAVNVSFFRPYLWEVKNPLMAIASLESTLAFFLTISVLVKLRSYRVLFKDPFLVFCLTFSLVFAFAVGVSTYNFGTLVRYKLPATLFFYPMLLILGGQRSFKY
ncbi:MAG: hypothetical protein KI790_06930 [Cyclobacteriaceae bacterium]|nr:hypothetical protein [Cyclobacteriaceae bacterium HetDA_MAG_MS6]